MYDGSPIFAMADPGVCWNCGVELDPQTSHRAQLVDGTDIAFCASCCPSCDLGDVS